jgi:hypothetical protein
MNLQLARKRKIRNLTNYEFIEVVEIIWSQLNSELKPYNIMVIMDNDE